MKVNIIITESYITVENELGTQLAEFEQLEDSKTLECEVCNLIKSLGYEIEKEYI